jgi:hypothetical protein
VKADDSIGPEVEEKVVALPNGGVLLLENLKLYKEEKKNDLKHAKKLASNANFYVNDTFGTTHRAHASTKGVMYGVPVAVIAGVWCLFLLLNSSFSHSYYDYPGMSISKASSACSCFEELFKVLLKTVA